MTVAAIDRIVHHATIIEIDTDSYRRKEHKKKGWELHAQPAMVIVAKPDRIVDVEHVGAVSSVRGNVGR